MRASRKKTAWMSLAMASLLSFVGGMAALAEAPAAETRSALDSTATDAQHGDVLKSIREEIAQVRTTLVREQERQSRITGELDRTGLQLTEQRARIRTKENSVAQMRRDFESHIQKALESDEVRLDGDLADYRRAAKELTELRQSLSPLESESQKLNAELAKSKRASVDLNTHLEALIAREKQVLVRTAFASLRTHSTIEHGFSVKCQDNMTIRECTEHSKRTALREGVSAFRIETLKRLVSELKSDRDPGSLPLEVEVAGFEVLKQEFQGNSSHYTRLRIELSSRPDEKLACQLVGIGAEGCSALFVQADKVDTKQVAAITEPGAPGRWAPLTVRSNVYDDEVFINNAPYGPTPVTVTLPTGEYRVEVRKQGYEPAATNLALNRAKAVVLELKGAKR